MEDKKINDLIDKILEAYDEELEKDPEVKRIAARSGAPTGKPDKPMSYEDWVKQQPKSGMPIGIHKRKKR